MAQLFTKDMAAMIKNMMPKDVTMTERAEGNFFGATRKTLAGDTMVIAIGYGDKKGEPCIVFEGLHNGAVLVTRKNEIATTFPRRVAWHIEATFMDTQAAIEEGRNAEKQEKEAGALLISAFPGVVPVKDKGRTYFTIGENAMVWYDFAKGSYMMNAKNLEMSPGIIRDIQALAAQKPVETKKPAEKPAAKDEKKAPEKVDGMSTEKTIAEQPRKEIAKGKLTGLAAQAKQTK